nr:alanine racemase [Salinibacter sp. 10B]
MDLAALRHNVRRLQAEADGADLMAIVKADAYGHGAIPIAEVLQEEGIQHFAVARPSEGVQLRNAGLTGRILVLGAPFPNHLSVYTEHDLDVTVSSFETANAAIEQGRPHAPVRVHVNVDTGMGRIGLSPEEASSVIADLADARGVTLAGIWTHFATADEPESTFADTQLSHFEELLDGLDQGIHPEHIHTANTGALLTIGTRSQRFHAPLVRTGIALYGLTAHRKLHSQLDLRPVMRLRARVTQIKTVAPGTPISYGAHWRAPCRTCIATLGVGYGDGYPRLCSGRASVRIGGEKRPVVGTICMDMCMVDLGPPDQSPAQDVQVGDEAELFGASAPTLYDVAEWAETIPYEICCGISPRVPRRYVDDSTETEAKIAANAPPSHNLS